MINIPKRPEDLDMDHDLFKERVGTLHTITTGIVSGCFIPVVDS